MTEIHTTDVTDWNSFRLNIPSRVLVGFMETLVSRDYGEIEVNELDHEIERLKRLNNEMNIDTAFFIQSFALTFNTYGDLSHEDYIFLSHVFMDPSLEKIKLGFDYCMLSI